MADYTRVPQSFAFRGISLLPADRLAPGQLPFAQNIRSYEEGTIQPRDGLTQVTDVTLGGNPVHTIARLNDTTPFASIPARRYAGAGTVLYTADPSVNTYTSLDTGYSGDPLSIVMMPPVRSPQPWAYIGDRTKIRKSRVNGEVYPIGSAQHVLPTTSPAVALGQPGLTVIHDFDNAADWTQVGAIAAAPTDVTRVNTTISAIVYDAGTTGYASIAPAAMTNITPGTRVEIDGSETVLVTDILIAVASTTIAAIIYDSGTSGLCTIQPAASLGTGQLEGPTLQDYQRRLQQTGASGGPRVAVPRGQPLEPTTSGEPVRLTRIRQVDFPVNCLVTLNGSETVRIISVAVGPDGVQSFRCSTSGTFSAGHTIAGLAGFRAYTAGTFGASDTVVADAVQQVLTTVSTAPVVAGLQDATNVNLAQVAGRAVQPDDYIHLAIKVDLLSAVREVRLYLNIDPSVNYLNNYFMLAWRASDLISAVQSTNAAVVDTIQDARQGAVLQDQINQPVEGDRTAVPRTGDTGRTAVPRSATGGATPGGYTPSPSATFVGRVAVPRASASDATSLNASSPQLALGNNQWIDLTSRVRDLIRIGTDHALSLANVNGVQVLLTLAGQTGAVTVQYDSAWVSGGYGPDAGAVGVPYLYTYRGRSSLTGVVTNPSPATRGGVMPRRQRVTLTGTQYTDAQIDLVDWFKFGGALTSWRYAGTTANAATPTFTDDTADGALDSGEPLAFDRFQPWPTTDLPRTGTCNVAGTAVSRTAGATFDLSWAPGTLIVVNGITTTIYAVASTTLLHVTTNCGSGTGVTFDVPEPLKLAQPLPAHWGGVVQGVQFLFACGDPTDPGALHWSHGNDPDTTSDAHWLNVSSASEPLQHGFVEDGRAFVFSSEQLYEIEPAFGSPSLFVARDTPCGRGLWTRWSFCVRPEGIYFLAKDGIYLTAWGGPAVSVTDPDLRELFPHDGTAGRNVNGIPPPNMAATTALRLSAVDGLIYFDYDATGSGRRTLIFDPIGKRWMFDQYDRETIGVRASEPGGGVHNHILGGTGGHLYQYSSSAMADLTTPIAWTVWAQHVDGGDPRLDKRFGDLILDADTAGCAAGLTVAPTANHDSVVFASETFTTAGRRPHIIDLVSGNGILARNMGLRISSSLASTDPSRPRLYTWEPSFIPKGVVTERRATDWDNLGYPGAKFVQGIIIHANTFGVSKTVQIHSDGAAVPVTIAVNHEGEFTKAYPLEGSWTPFVSELVRLMSTDDVDWELYDVRWVWEPAPELATHWETQFTTHDLPGYLAVRDLVVAHQSTTPLTLRIVYDDGPTEDYVIPSSGGGYTRDYVITAAGKGRAVSYRLTSDSPFRLFKKDLSCRVQGWGLPGGYLQTMPFGGPSRADGAHI